MTKVCRLCGAEKPLTEFYFRKEQLRHRTDSAKQDRSILEHFLHRMEVI